MNPSSVKPVLAPFSCRRLVAPRLPAWRMRLGLGVAAALLALGGARAQGPAAPAPGPAASAAPAPDSTPGYAASDLARAFGFMDRDQDGKVSRQEAAPIRGVAKNFERADTDQDGWLSREEFDTAMNHARARHPEPSAAR